MKKIMTAELVPVGLTEKLGSFGLTEQDLNPNQILNDFPQVLTEIRSKYKNKKITLKQYRELQTKVIQPVIDHKRKAQLFFMYKINIFSVIKILSDRVFTLQIDYEILNGDCKGFRGKLDFVDKEGVAAAQELGWALNFAGSTVHLWEKSILKIKDKKFFIIFYPDGEVTFKSCKE